MTHVLSVLAFVVGGLGAVTILALLILRILGGVDE